MTNLTLRSDADQINDYLAGKQAQLSDALRLHVQRLERVADLLAREASIRVVAKKMCRLWPDECSPATAYRWIGEAQDVFSTEKLHDRAFYVDALLAKNASNRAKAEVKQDLKTVAACDKLELEIITKHMGSNEAMPIDKIQPPRMLVGFYPELTGAALPANWEAQVAGIVRTRQVGIVADHADFKDAEILDNQPAQILDDQAPAEPEL